MLDLNKLKELEKKVSEGPWAWQKGTDTETIILDSHNDWVTDNFDAEANAELIVLLRNSFKDMIAEIEAGRALREAVGKMEAVIMISGMGRSDVPEPLIVLNKHWADLRDAALRSYDDAVGKS